MSESSAPPAVRWQSAGSYQDVLYETCDEGIARITINRPEKRNAFRPRTVVELAPRPMAAGPSAPAAIRACGAMAAMSTRQACRG
jgi:1,4-dihydroxy-2-naphthoyl-CoA synthase